MLDVPDWAGHLAGQHVDVRLTAPDGYTATRSYSIASVPDGELVEVTVERVDDGEVSPYLVDEVRPGDQLEVRGPIGGWFVWRPEQTEPVLLVAGGSGVVPLMAMLRRTRRRLGRRRSGWCTRSATPEALLYADELAHAGEGAAPSRSPTSTPGPPRPAGDGRSGRLDADLLDRRRVPAGRRGRRAYVCGPTGFVETVADLLVTAGHDPARVRTERFGPQEAADDRDTDRRTWTATRWPACSARCSRST